MAGGANRGARAALALLVAGTVAGTACHRSAPGGGGPSEQRAFAVVATSAASAAQILASLQAAPGSPVQPGIAQSFTTAGTAVQAQFPAWALAGEPKLASVSFPATASGALHLKDVVSGISVDVSLSGALPVAAQTASGYVVYPAAFPGGAHLLHRALVNGSEEFIGFQVRPAVPEVAYTVAVGAGVGLRLVAGTLEFVEAASGAPRVHVAPPYIVGADGTATAATLAISDCAVETDPSAPWGRAVTPPGASTCTLRVTWPDASVQYPAVLDPRWTTTGSMATARTDFTLTLLSTGNALAAGGRSSASGTTGLATAEVYNKASGSWAATASMTGGRYLHSVTQLGTTNSSTTSGKVLVAGGTNSGSSLNTAQLYSASAGTWVAATNLNAARHAFTATLLADGRVLAAGGLNGSTTLQTAALYDPSSGAGTWTATIGPIPPPGLKFNSATLIQTTNSQLNNKVLLVGGNDGTQSISAVYLFDPAQSAFSTLASIPSPTREQHTAVVLPNNNGQILIAGGKSGSSVLASAIKFDPSSGPGSWSAAGTMTSPRVAASATVLSTSIVANGKVLVAGGSNGTSTLSSAELFSDTTAWTATPSLPGPMQNQQAVLLGNNFVLAAGGLSNSTTVQSTAYLYDASFGLGCSSNSQCPTGNCVNGVCCDTACNAGTCEACNLAGHLGTCTPLASGTVCRTSAGSCDVAETCNGTAVTCPADGFQPTTTVCRSAAGECDIAENCTGTSASCPADAKKASGAACTDDGNVCTKDQCDGTNVTCQHPAGNAGSVCRASAGACDVAETCTGTSATCPTNAFLASGTVCRASAGACDVAEVCSGTSASCPADRFKSSSTVCRASAGACDIAEKCTGTSASCPADALLPATTVCRTSAGACDIAENCTGTTANCPPDAFLPATTVCRTSAGVCDIAENCPGASANCPPDAFLPSSVPCRASAGACDVAESCTGTSAACPPDGFSPSSTVCRPAASQCDAVETCTGASATCPADGPATNGTACSDGNACTQIDACQGGVCVGSDPAVLGVPQSDPTVPKCPDGSPPIGCRAYDCMSGLSTGTWLAAPSCGPSYPACVAACPTAGCSETAARIDDLVSCSCSCADPAGGSPFDVQVTGCGTSSSTSCDELCSHALSACGRESSCEFGLCEAVASTAPIVLVAGACRVGEADSVPIVSDYVGVVDNDSSSLTLSVGSTTTAVALSGSIGFQIQPPGADGQVRGLLLGRLNLLGAPFDFFGRHFDSPRLDSTGSAVASLSSMGAGLYAVSLPTGLSGEKVSAIVDGTARTFDAIVLSGLVGSLDLAAGRIVLNSSGSLPSGDSISLKVNAQLANLPPMARISAIPGATIECNRSGGADLTLDGSGSTDPEGQPLRYQWFSEGLVLGAQASVGVRLPLGASPITLSVTDPQLAGSRSKTTVTVADTTPPTIPTLLPVTFHAGSEATERVVTLNLPHATDVCDTAPTTNAFVLEIEPDTGTVRVPIDPTQVTLSVGTHTIVWQVTDRSGNLTEATQSVQVLSSGSPSDDPPPEVLQAPPCPDPAQPLNLPGPTTVDVDIWVCVVGGKIQGTQRVGNALWSSCPDVDDAVDTCTTNNIQTALAQANTFYSSGPGSPPSINFAFKGWKRIGNPEPITVNPMTHVVDPSSSLVDPSTYGQASLDPPQFGGGFPDLPRDRVGTMYNNCYAAWGVRPPGSRGSDFCVRGIVVLLLQKTLDSDSLGVGAPSACPATGDNVDDPNPTLNGRACDWSLPTICDKTYNPKVAVGTDAPALEFAHEIGHALGLPHGDGKDNDCNGQWDEDPEDCDNNELTLDDTPRTYLMARSTAEWPAGGPGPLTALQQDRARTFALKSVGSPNIGNFGDNCVGTFMPAPPPPPPPDDNLQPLPPIPDGGAGSGGGGTGGSPPPPSSCSCAFNDGGGPPWAFIVSVLAMVLAGLRRRRRS